MLESVPEIMEVVGGPYTDQVLPVNEQDKGAKEMQFLQSVFIKLMSAESKVVSSAVSKLISRINMEKKVRRITSFAMV